MWVREHVFPRSLGTPNLGFEFVGADAHHLRSIDSQRNNSRSNRIFEEGSGIDMSYITTAGNWYPGNQWKGDIARMIMYMYVRYTTQCLPTNVGVGSTSYSPLADMPNVFLDWNQQDPVSQYEINRNNILNTLQGNRNPFIDNPYLATIIWNGPQATDTWGILSTQYNLFSNITIYPTITKDIVHISNTNNTQYTYKIYNTFGQLIETNTTTDIIDITNNTKGLYLINLQLENQTKTFKVILN